MKKLVLIALAAISVVLAGCTLTATAQAPEKVTRTYALSGFSSVEVSGDFLVSVSQGDFAVSVDIAEEIEPYLRVRVRGGELRVSYENLPVKLSRLIDRSNYRTAVRVSLPEIKAIDLSGACTLSAHDIGSADLEIDCSGASKVKLSGEFGKLGLDCSGASKVVLSGKAGKFSMDCAGASKVDAAGLLCGSASVELNGASSASVRAAKKLDLECSGASKVEYKVEEDTTVRIESSGASKIVRIK